MDKKSILVGVVIGLIGLALAKKFGGATVNNAVAKIGL